MLVNRVEHGRYLDSVALMRAARRVESMPGVEAAALMIGSPSNKALMREAGLLGPEGEPASANDLVIAIRGEGAQAALARALLLLEERPRTDAPGLPRARSLGSGMSALPQANLALVSVPGEFAAYEARKALERGLHVLLFSDNVALEDEVSLKRFAAEKGLLLMGPDCGTAHVAGTPLGFANALPRGDIGLVSASGTGLQEVSCLIARMGGGISHGIGVGGRDLDARVGGLGTLGALDALESDPNTSRIVLISKPPAPEVAQLVLQRMARVRKPSVVCFLGLDAAGVAPTLKAAAEQIMESQVSALAVSLPRKRRGRVQGLFCGGTLCAEAEIIFRRRGLQGHSFVDLGDDAYTRGRPHPMIEPEIRNAHIARAAADPDVAVLLVDVVLGYGAHESPASVLLQNDFGTKTVVASVTGTELDPQGWTRQVRMLSEAGVLVAASNADAAELAASLV